MFKTLNNAFCLWPMMLGLSVAGPVLALTVGLQIVWPQVLDLRMPVPNVPAPRLTVLVKPRKLIEPGTLGPKSISNANRQNVADHRATPMAFATPGTPQWQAHVVRGRGLDFDIYAEHSLPVLEAYGITLALDTLRPHGDTLLYDLRTRSLRNGPVPSSAIVRALEGMPAEFEAVRRNAERQLGAPARFWALYDPDLYDALRSLTEEALRQQAVPLDAVRTARVRLSLVGGRTFVVELVDHS
jgi:hypothetical protein